MLTTTQLLKQQLKIHNFYHALSFIKQFLIIFHQLSRFYATIVYTKAKGEVEAWKRGGKNQIYKDLKRIIISHEDVSLFSFHYFSSVFSFFRKRHLLARSSFDSFSFQCLVLWLVSVDYGGYKLMMNSFSSQKTRKRPRWKTATDDVNIYLQTGFSHDGDGALSFVIT